MADTPKTPEEWSAEFHKPEEAPALPDPLDVMADMGETAASELAKEAATVPPDVAPPEVPRIEPPPTQDILTEMGKVAEQEAGFHKQKEPQLTAWQKRHLPGPFKVAPPPQMDVMKEMNEAIEEAREGPKEVLGLPPADLDRAANFGAEQERVMTQRFAMLLESMNRMFDTQNKTLKTAAEMIADHERKIHEIAGLLERSRA